MNIESNPISRRRALLLLLAATCLALLPFLGLSDFNTKGEPREAVVAYTMLEHDDWILPVNNGGEMPYKPPFFHWCVAAASLLNGGIVNEYTSRLPSALALVAMSVSVFLFFARRRDTATGLLTALVTFTAFEIYRAGMNCRVDMVLTALMVGAIISLYRWGMDGMRRFPWAAILLMSCATLTKGPVGIILPCLSVGVFLLLRGVPFFKAFIWLCLWGCLSLLIPLAWYAAAYARGGEEFLDLVIEENFGRMTGTMAYESHLNPWWYNLVTLAAGLLPWTIAVVTALFVVPRKAWGSAVESLRTAWGRFRVWRHTTPPCTLLALTASVIIFLFYCIPASKRSVYLMPMYPFTAYFIAAMLTWMARRRAGSVRGLGDFIAVLACVLLAVFVVVKCGAVPDSIFGHGKHAAQNVAMLDSLEATGGILAWACAVISPLCAVIWWWCMRRNATGIGIPLAVTGLVVSAYISLSGCYQPAVLQPKSVKGMAADIEERFPDAPSHIYEFISGAEKSKGNPLHYFELNYYMGDVIRNFRRERPAKGYLLIGASDMEEYGPQFGAEGYTFSEAYAPAPTLPRHTPTLYRFTLETNKTGVKSK